MTATSLSRFVKGKIWHLPLVIGMLTAFLLVGNVVFSSGAYAAGQDPDPALQQTVTDEEQNAPAGTKVEITHGHVDLGPRLLNGKWIFMARDDSGDTPTWRHLDDMVFVLGKSAALALPDNSDYNFVGAKAGATVWAIPQVEVASVPWLGWNTQSPAVVNNVQAQVKLVFEGHQGPGQFTMFLQSGNFGAPQLLWTSAKENSQAVHVDLNTHTHANWVFTEPGVHLVRLSAKATLKDGQSVSAPVVLRFAVGDTPDVSKAKQASWTGGAQGKGADEAVDTGTKTTTGSDNEASNATLIKIGIGILAAAVVLVVVGVAVSLSSKRAKLKALAELNEEKR